MKFMIFVKSNLSLEKSLEERERIERADFPNVEIEVIVETTPTRMAIRLFA